MSRDINSRSSAILNQILSEDGFHELLRSIAGFDTAKTVQSKALGTVLLEQTVYYACCGRETLNECYGDFGSLDN